MSATTRQHDFPSTDTLRIEQLEARLAEYEARNLTQDGTITRYQRDNDGLTRQLDALQKRVDILQGMADWRQEKIDRLEADQTAQARAERHFK